MSGVDRVLTFIEGLRLQIGDRLPGERDLAGELRVSRNTVREALVVLASQGKVEIRGRSGCYMACGSPCSWLALRDSAEPAAILELLRAIGPQLAAKAADNCRPEKYRRLETITTRLGRTLVERDTARTVGEFLNYLALLASLSGNPYFELAVREAAAAKALPLALRGMDKAALEAFFALHVSLLQAVQSHDSRRASTLAGHCIEAFCALFGTLDGGEARSHRDDAA